MKKIVLIFLFSICTLQAQQNTTSTGGEAIGTGGTASYSVGQIDYISNSDSNFSVSQGVQQPFEISVVLGLEENHIKLNLAAYPNPTNDQAILSLNLSTSASVSIWLYNTAGICLKSWQFNNEQPGNGELILDLKEIQAGIYFCKIQVGNEMVTKKIIKTKAMAGITGINHACSKNHPDEATTSEVIS